MTLSFRASPKESLYQNRRLRISNIVWTTKIAWIGLAFLCSTHGFIILMIPWHSVCTYNTKNRSGSTVIPWAYKSVQSFLILSNLWNLQSKHFGPYFAWTYKLRIQRFSKSRIFLNKNYNFKAIVQVKSFRPYNCNWNFAQLLLFPSSSFCNMDSIRWLYGQNYPWLSLSVRMHLLCWKIDRLHKTIEELSRCWTIELFKIGLLWIKKPKNGEQFSAS